MGFSWMSDMTNRERSESLLILYLIPINDYMKFSLFLIIFLLVIVFICGCTQTVSKNKPGLTTEIPITSMTAATTMTPSPTTISVPPADLIIGTWMGYNYLASGKIERVWNFTENNTWNMTNMNVKSQKKNYVNGVWKKESTGTYQVIPSSGRPDTFTYNVAKDEFSDTYFGETYTRITDITVMDNPHDQVPTLNITLFSAQSVPGINGSHPYPGNKFLIVNISIKNINETGGYSFTDDSIMAVSEDGQGSNAINQKSEGKLENPFPSGTIGPGESKQGNVIFGVPENSQDRKSVV